MGLENILKSIEEKVNIEIEKLMEEAGKEKERIIEKARGEAQEKKRELLKKFEKETKNERKRKLIKTKMEEKKKILALKQKFMKDAFQKAKQSFSNLNKGDYLRLFKEALLSNIDSGEERILISPRDKLLIDEQFMQELKNELNKRGKEAKIKFIPELDEEERGFIIKKKGVQMNCTFSTLLSELKDKIEIEVAQRLF